MTDPLREAVVRGWARKRPKAIPSYLVDDIADELRAWLLESPSTEEIDAAAKAMYERPGVGVSWDACAFPDLMRKDALKVLAASRSVLVGEPPNEVRVAGDSRGTTIQDLNDFGVSDTTKEQT